MKITSFSQKIRYKYPIVFILRAGTYKKTVVKKVAQDRKCKFVYVCIDADDRYAAKDLFKHSGVAAHPGNEGMEEIANHIFDKIEQYL